MICDVKAKCSFSKFAQHSCDILSLNTFQTTQGELCILVMVLKTFSLTFVSSVINKIF